MIFNKLSCSAMPADFVKLSSIDPSIIQSTRYFSKENFLGRPVPGYHMNEFYCTHQSATALKQVNTEMKKYGYLLVVYDAYRPQRAVNAFVAWRDEAADVLAKKKYYPSISKKEIFAHGYILAKSKHSCGSTFDLTIIPINHTVKPVKVSTRKLKNGETIPFLDDNTVDMGSSFDLFHPVSHHGSTLITPEQAKMRLLLKKTMQAHGFVGIPSEWWHYTLQNEPHPHAYFDWVAAS